MARRRFFPDQIRNGYAQIGDENAHHLTRVLRVQVGQTYEISDERRVWLATVESARKDLVTFRLGEELQDVEELADTTLYLALFKFDRYEWAIEKATELGATTIVPVETKRSEPGLLEGAKKRVERWRRIAKEASEQSRRLMIPIIEEPVRFAQIAAERVAPGNEIGVRVWLDERRGSSHLLGALNGAETESGEPAVSAAIGPEGGWTDEEREMLASGNWKAASLGSTILRAETAVCSALAIVTAWRATRSR